MNGFSDWIGEIVNVDWVDNTSAGTNSTDWGSVLNSAGSLLSKGIDTYGQIRAAKTASEIAKMNAQAQILQAQINASNPFGNIDLYGNNQIPWNNTGTVPYYGTSNDDTLLYLGIGGVALASVFLLMKGKKK
jgi:hypothetical protein